MKAKKSTKIIASKLFISYSWSSPEHEQWVLQLATELRDSGVDVILDKWDLKEGNDANAFMEKMVTDSNIKKVLIVCDKKYAVKADDRSGGVGTETQIISREVYDQEDQDKFVAVVTEKNTDGRPYLPTYYKSRIYIDLSDSDLYAKNFEQLLRWIYNKPLYIKPAIGKKPIFLDASDTISLGTSAKFKRTLEAIRNNKDYASGALSEYFDSFVQAIEKFRISSDQGEFDEKVIQSIEQFIPYRNEAIEIFLAIAQYAQDQGFNKQIHRFFEQLIPLLEPTEGLSSWKDWDFDNLKFIIQELLLYCVSAFLKYECFETVAYLLRHRFFVEQNAKYGSNIMVSFRIFSHRLKSLDHRNQRLELRRISLHSDLLESRNSATGISLNQLMQADFVLFLRDSLDALRSETRQRWHPESLLYQAIGRTTLELFHRAESKEYFDELKCILDISSKNDLEPLLTAFQEGKLYVPRWTFETINPKELMNYDNLATLP